VKINLDRLFDISERGLTTFRDIDNMTVLKDTPNQLLFQDNDSDILAIAHLDTVQRFATFQYDYVSNLLYCETLDDRLGAYIILDLLPSLGIKLDVLLTANEESLNSSAQFFKPNKKYNWIVEFDRAGDDVVSYQYESKRLRKRLRSVGFENGYGSYSDIVELDFLNIQAINIGIGYELNHSKNAFADINVMIANIEKFIKFYNSNKDKLLKYDNKTPYYATRKISKHKWYKQSPTSSYNELPYDDGVLYESALEESNYQNYCTYCGEITPIEELIIDDYYGCVCLNCIDRCRFINETWSNEEKRLQNLNNENDYNENPTLDEINAALDND